MDRVSGLNANQVAKELQGYKRYNGKTQKEIKEKLGGVSVLRDELRRLESKKVKSIKKDKKVENIENINKDVIYEIILKLDYPDIIHYCNTNNIYKSTCDTRLWQLLIARDFPFLPDDDLESRNMYETFFNFYDKWTTIIMSKFIIYKTKYINMQNVYKQIFTTLIKYKTLYNEIDLKEDGDNNYILQNTLALQTFYQLFDILTIPINKVFKPHVINPPSDLSKKDDRDKIKYISSLFYKMDDELMEL
jgi:hypothetical protein